MSAIERSLPIIEHLPELYADCLLAKSGFVQGGRPFATLFHSPLFNHHGAGLNARPLVVVIRQPKRGSLHRVPKRHAQMMKNSGALGNRLR